MACVLEGSFFVTYSVIGSFKFASVLPVCVPGWEFLLCYLDLTKLMLAKHTNYLRNICKEKRGLKKGIITIVC